MSDEENLTPIFTTEFLTPKLVKRFGYMTGLSLRQIGSIGHWCPGCKEIHDFPTEALYNGAKWAWNNSMTNPTFTPSMNIIIGPSDSMPRHVCHYILFDGTLQYLNDCTHEFKGQKIALPDIPKEAVRNSTIVSS